MPADVTLGCNCKAGKPRKWGNCACKATQLSCTLFCKWWHKMLQQMDYCKLLQWNQHSGCRLNTWKRSYTIKSVVRLSYIVIDIPLTMSVCILHFIDWWLVLVYCTSQNPESNYASHHRNPYTMTLRIYVLAVTIGILTPILLMLKVSILIKY